MIIIHLAPYFLCMNISIPRRLYIDRLMQDCSISIANTLEIPQSCTKPSIWYSKLLGVSVCPGGPVIDPISRQQWPNEPLLLWLLHNNGPFLAIMAGIAGPLDIGHWFMGDRTDIWHQELMLSKGSILHPWPITHALGPIQLSHE